MFGLRRKPAPAPEPKPEKATIYPDCPMCQHQTYWVPKSRGEIIIRFGLLHVRQYFDCAECGVRARLIRQGDLPEWQFQTINT